MTQDMRGFSRAPAQTVPVEKQEDVEMEKGDHGADEKPSGDTLNAGADKSGGGHFRGHLRRAWS